MLCTLLAFADVQNIACTGKLGTSISFRLDIQINNIGAVAGQITYYRKDNSTRMIPVFGNKIGDEDDVDFTVYAREYDGVKVCGYITLDIKNERVVDGRWTLDTKDLAMNSLKESDVKPGTRFFNPVTSVSKAVGSYSFSYNSGSTMMPEYGGSCELTNSNGKIAWSMGQVTPNIAEGEGVSEFDCSQFDGEIDNFKFSAYVDERFVYVWRTNPEAGICHEFGNNATLEGIYVKKDFYKSTMKDLVDWTVGVDDGDREKLVAMDLLNKATEEAEKCVNGDDASQLVNLLEADPLPIKAADILGFKKVRSYQFNNGYLSSYPFFSCKMTQEMKSIVFTKTAGSQRKTGTLSRWSDYYLAFNGYYFYNGDAIVYDAEHHELGVMKKVSDRTMIMVFQRNKFGAFEVYELAK